MARREEPQPLAPRRSTEGRQRSDDDKGVVVVTLVGVGHSTQSSLRRSGQVPATSSKEVEACVARQHWVRSIVVSRLVERAVARASRRAVATFVSPMLSERTATGRGRGAGWTRTDVAVARPLLVVLVVVSALWLLRSNEGTRSNASDSDAARLLIADLLP